MMKKKFDDEVGMDKLIAVAFKYPRSERIAIMGFLADYAHEFELEKEVVAKIYTLINEKSETPEKKHQAKHMPACFGYDKGIGLLRFLKEKGFVERSADPDSFLYFMGCLPLEPELLKPIGWMKSKQLLREMLEQAFAEHIDNGVMRKVELEQLTPACFIDKTGSRIELPKNKREMSLDSDMLVVFFATFSDRSATD